MEYLIRLPWPPQKTSANAKGQGRFFEKARAGKSYKATCAKECLAQGVSKLGDVVVEVSVVFCPPKTVSRYDFDNTLGRCKQGLDAVSEAIGIDDGKWQRMTMDRGTKGGEGAVLVHVKPMVEIPIMGVIT